MSYLPAHQCSLFGQSMDHGSGGFLDTCLHLPITEDRMLRAPFQQLMVLHEQNFFSS